MGSGEKRAKKRKKEDEATAEKEKVLGQLNGLDAKMMIDARLALKKSEQDETQKNQEEVNNVQAQPKDSGPVRQKANPNDPYYKTQMCPQFSLGKCTVPTQECFYAHAQEELRMTPEARMRMQMMGMPPHMGMMMPHQMMGMMPPGMPPPGMGPLMSHPGQMPMQMPGQRGGRQTESKKKDKKKDEKDEKGKKRKDKKEEKDKEKDKDKRKDRDKEKEKDRDRGKDKKDKGSKDKDRGKDAKGKQKEKKIDAFD